MPVGINLRGTPGTGPVPHTMLPGSPTMPPSATGPIQSRIQQDAQADAAWSQMAQSSNVQAHLAANAARNQQATASAVMGYGASGLGYTSGSQPVSAAGANPFGQYVNPQYGSAAYYLRNISQSTQQTATNTAAGRPAPGFGGFGGGGFPPGTPPGGGGPNIPNFGWGPGGGGPPIVPNLGWGPGGGAAGGGGGGGQPPRGGGGGTAGGGGNRGGGLGGALPFAGMLGLGSTSRLLTAGVELGIAGKVIEELAFLPQHILGVEGAAMGNAMPYWNYRTQAAGMGRAGGFAGEAMSKQFYQGVESPEWMQRLGLGPQQSLDMLQNFGILPGSADESRRVVEQLGSMRFMPALGGLPEGQAEQSAGLFSKYGMFADTGARSPYFSNDTGAKVDPFTPPSGQISQYTAQITEVMARAQELGLNRSAVMRSIDTTLQTAVTRGGGVGYTPQAIGNELMRYSSLPGGRTGEVGMSMIAAASQFSQGVGSDPLPTIAYSGLAQRLQSESDIEKYTEKTSPGFIDRMKRNPATAKLLQEYVQARKDGHMPAATQLLAELFRQDPGLPSRVANTEGAAGSMPEGYLRDTATANSMGTGVLPVIAANLPQGGPGGKLNQSRADQTRAFYMARGYSTAASTGIAGYYAEETGGNFDPRAFNPKGGGQGAQGMGQWRGDRIAAFTKMFGHSPIDPRISDEQLFQEQLQFGDWELKNSPAAGGADAALKGATTGAEAGVIMVDKFGRPGADTPQAERNAAAYANRMDNQPDFSGLPEGMLKAQSLGQAGVLAGSQVSATEAAVLIPVLNRAIQAMIDGLAKGQQILSSDAMNPAGSFGQGALH